MAGKNVNKIVKAYLDTYRKLVASEIVEDKRESVTISIPLHFAGDHRIEVTVTEFSAGRFLLSDMGRTLGELSESGSTITPDFKARAENIIERFGVSIAKEHLIMETRGESVGSDIQRFSEAAKTIGDAYLLQRPRSPHASEVVSRVKEILNARQLDFKEKQKVDGAIERHLFDLYSPPNGRPGLAVAVVAGYNTHSLAKIWAFNCKDVKDKYESRLKLGVVLDEEDSAPWTQQSQRILNSSADIVARSTKLGILESSLLYEGF